MSIDAFQAIEAQVRKAALASYTYGWNSPADPVFGATGFRDADGYYYPFGNKGSPHLGDFNHPDSKYYDPDKYFEIVTNGQEMEQFRRGHMPEPSVFANLYFLCLP